ncbi:hypothetical protein Arub01_22380 [Actinomadura rubrobrunea]|uniref:Uncharacterized protein n=2 Tax=Actinomadura rubrobrunea TaxID=115335 RepID=A0A9W6UUJ8_9ACTN|nr:hypothetical protein Arub01_22380 [Actinomadura rubrobrunea]
MTASDRVRVSVSTGATRCERRTCPFTAMISIHINDRSINRTYDMCWLHWRNLVALHANGGASVHYEDQAVELIARAN